MVCRLVHCYQVFSWNTSFVIWCICRRLKELVLGLFAFVVLSCSALSPQGHCTFPQPHWCPGVHKNLREEWFFILAEHWTQESRLEGAMVPLPGKRTQYLLGAYPLGFFSPGTYSFAPPTRSLPVVSNAPQGSPRCLSTEHRRATSGS